MAAGRLGAEGPALFPVGLGTVKLGRNTDVKYPRPFDLPDDAEVERLLSGALAEGIRLLDTAPAYGRAEERLRPFLARHRDELLLASKAGEEYGPEGSRYDFSAAAILRSCERSLGRLGTDRLDLLLLHSDGDDLRILERTDALEGLHRLRREGKALQVGISAKTEAGIRGAIDELDVVMAPLSRSAPGLSEALAEAHEAGLGVLAIKVMDSGHLAAGEDRAGAAAAALRFALEKPYVDAVVLGTLRVEHLRQAAALARSLRGEDA